MLLFQEIARLIEDRIEVAVEVVAVRFQTATGQLGVVKDDAEV
jgi:hypothetical protein